MRILITGASSFTGFWFVRQLIQAGHEVAAIFRGRSIEDYTDVRAQRVAELTKLAKCYWQMSFGDDAFLELLRSGFDVLCHHAADARNYRSEDFDYLTALGENTRSIRSTLEICQKNQTTLVLTCSVFEANQGAGSEPLRAFSPYGLSKTLTREAFIYYAESMNVPLKLFTIPNPFGPYEEPRFTQYLVKTWATGQIPEVKTPDYVRDNIPVDLLALCYVNFLSRKQLLPIEKMNPSGYVESQGQFARRFASELSCRLGIELQVKLQKQTDFTEPLIRINTEPGRQIVPDWAETPFWDATFQYYSGLLTMRSGR